MAVISLKNARRRAKRKKAAPEYRLQRQAIHYLEAVLPMRAFVTSIGHGRRGPKHGAQLKAMGVKAGLPDVLVLLDGRPYWLECKAGKGRLAPAQELCHALIAGAGCDKPAVVRSIDDVERALTYWNIERRGEIAA